MKGELKIYIVLGNMDPEEWMVLDGSAWGVEKVAT
jgi:hypothetical protein